MLLTRRRFLQSVAALTGYGLLAAQVGCVRTAGYDPPAERRTLPEIKDELRLLALGDWGNGSRQQREVAQGMHSASRELGGFHAGLMLGDNFYPSGVASTSDEKWLTHFRHVYDTSELGNLKWHAVLGNHDWAGNVEAQIEYTRQSNHWSMPGHYWRQDFGQSGEVALAVIGIDTDPHYEKWSEQLAWLEGELKAARRDGKPCIVMGHHPVFSYSRHGPTKHVADGVQPLLEAHGAMAYLCGHDHNLQVCERRGILYAVLGGGGAGLYDVESGVLTKFQARQHGFGVLRVSKKQLSLECRDVRGATLYTHSLALA